MNFYFCFCPDVSKKLTTQKSRRGNYIIEEIEVDLVVVVQVWRVGAHFKALVKLESVMPLDLPCIFLRPKRGLRHIVWRDLRRNLQKRLGD